MNTGWQSKLTRASRMGWDELCTRARQELGKHADLAWHKFGLRPGPIRLELTPASGIFFFPHGGAGERAEVLRRNMPERAEEILREADEICQHRFRLLGYDNLDYGPVIDWHLDRVHGKRSPLDPWFKISFLDFSSVGDHKVTWELNRHQHLVTLAKASLLTSDDKYVNEIAAQWRSWVKANPYPLGINWGSSLEVAFRTLSWIWIDRLLAESAVYAPLRNELLASLAFHGRYIERYLSTYFSPNTHLLGEAVALVFLGTLCPEMPRAPRWKERGWNILLREAPRQVRPDGVYFEQSLYYHVYALDFFLYARQLAGVNGLAIPREYDDTLLQMLSVLQALAQAGVPEGFGDDDGGRVFDPHRDQTEHMTDPLALGTLAFDRDYCSASLTEESIWMFGDRAVEKLSRGAEAQSRGAAPQSAASTDGGIYILADSEPAPSVLAIDAGPQGVGRSGHGHADALSLRLTIDGERWLVDSGSGVYVAALPRDRDAFRGTAAHNTMRVDGADQAIADEPFSWKSIPVTRAETWLAGKSFAYFAGSHDGYERLADPVTHRRQVLRANGELWLVRDLAIGRAEHDLEINWHFAGDVAVTPTDTELIASRPSAKTTMRLVTPDSASWKTSITRGLISPSYGRLNPAPVVRCEARLTLPAEIAAALIASSKAQPKERPRLTSMQNEAVQVYELYSGSASHGFFFARGKRKWQFGPWSSDAELLYCRVVNEKIEQLVVIGGSAVDWQGQSLLTATEPSQFFEWRKCVPVRNAAPEDWAATALFDELTGPSGERSAGATISLTEKH